MFAMSHIMFVVLPLISGSIHVFLDEASRGEKQIVHRFLQHILFIGVGVQGLASAYMQAYEPEGISQFLGWTSSPLLIEVAKANFAFGLLGVLSPGASSGFKVATGIGYSIFLLCKAYGHIQAMLSGGYQLLSFTHPVLYSDLCIPFFILLLLVVEQIFHRSSPSDPKRINRDEGNAQ